MSSSTLLQGGRYLGSLSLLRLSVVPSPARSLGNTVFPLPAFLTLERTISKDHRFYSNNSRQLSNASTSPPKRGGLSTSSLLAAWPFSSGRLGRIRRAIPSLFDNCRRFRNSYHNQKELGENQSFSFSPIVETPFDSPVVEKPYTMIMMEDEVSYLSSKNNHNIDDNKHDEGHILGSDQEENNTNAGFQPIPTTASWIPTFRSKIPPEHGMSFGSICLNWQHHRGGTPSVAMGLQSLKSSQLPTISDAILVARGPVACLCAQYYLESFSLQGLIMIDPILVDDKQQEDNNGENKSSRESDAVFSLISRIYHGQDNCGDTDRFRSTRLLVEPNAVPMMVVLTAQNEQAWNRSSRFVASRHGDLGGVYGRVPIVDLTDIIGGTEEATAMAVLHCINAWIDEAL